jgi:MoxR-like ATPase
VQDFAVRVLEATHPSKPGGGGGVGGGGPGIVQKYVRFGGSPRGAQAMLLGAKIRALLAGRFAVSIDDVKAVARPTLRHRLILNFEGEAQGIDPDTIIDAILAETRAGAP